MKKRIVKQIIDKLLNEPDKWKFGDCTVMHESGIEIWIANIQIIDLEIYRPIQLSIGLIDRIKIIRAIAKCKQKKILSKLIQP